MRKFIHDLRTTKIEQGWGCLENAFSGANCCLGRACRVAMENGAGLTTMKYPPNDPSVLVFYKQGTDSCITGNTSVLPPLVQEWLGIDEPNPWLKDVNRQGDETGATALNDRYCYTFSQIADCFEATFLPEDWEKTLAARKES